MESRALFMKGYVNNLCVPIPFYLQSDLVICDIDDDLKKKIKAFKMRKEKNNAAIISKQKTFAIFYLVIFYDDPS